MALKPCLECKKEISTGISACPNCGKPSPHGTSTTVSVIGGIFGAFVLLVLIIANSGEHRAVANVHASQGTGSDVSTERSAAPTFTDIGAVSAKDLYRAYSANEVRADNQYKDKGIILSGIVRSIDKDFTGGIIVHLKTGDSFGTVAARIAPEFADKIAQQEKGDSVTIHCVVTGMTLTTPFCDMNKLR